MIPSKLELKNFICYPDAVQTISFDNYSMICLSGKNGNGKSALLDAITWVLWGQARKISGVSKADEGLLRLGQTRMMVSLEFELGTARYRVRREYAKTYGKPYAALDFEIFNEETKTFASLTDKTIRATQDKIERCIGLNFDTFINSAFLKQGQSNEFSKKTAKERKQILTNILGLEKYAKLQQLALEQVRKNTEEKRVLQKLDEQRSQELAQEQTFQDTFTQEKAALQELNVSLDQLLKNSVQLEQQKRLHEDQRRQYELLNKECLMIEEKKLSLEQAVHALVRQWKTTHYQSLQLPDMKKLSEERSLLAGQEKLMLQAHQQSLAIQEKMLACKERYQKQMTTLRNEQEQQCNALQLDLSKQELQLKQVTVEVTKKTEMIRLGGLLVKQLEQELVGLRKQVEPKVLVEQALIEQKAQFDKRRAFYQVLVQQGNRLNVDLKELQHKYSVIDHVESPACPLCQQFLAAGRKHALTQQLQQQGNFFAHQLQRLKQLIPKLKEMLMKQHQEIQQQEKVLSDYNQLILKDKEITHQANLRNEEITRFQQEVIGLQDEQKKLDQTITLLKKRYQEAQQMLAQKDQDPSIKEILSEARVLEQEKKVINFNQEAYLTLQSKLKEVDQLLERCQHLRHDLERQSERHTLITQHMQSLKELKKHREHLDAQLPVLHEALARLVTIEQTMEALVLQRTSLTERKDQALQRIGNLENCLQRLAVLKQEQEKSGAVRVKIEDEIEHYQALALAFSKDGIQALLIEEVIPEIEAEANGILAKLTNNQSQIFVESLRDLKSGGVKETLDIKIADNIGIRPYEMFSGGEAFRIDFALRIAISKLLARRAGTALQTLIIDEGFGSQDEDGLARLMDALHAIQHDFSKVIIVSHLAEFKDNFPVHFVVEKGSGGSIVHVEERG